MTWKKTRNKDKKRSTPKDVEDRKLGILHDKKEPKVPRKPKEEENRANKNCSRDIPIIMCAGTRAYREQLSKSG